jgi:hypothetical protein
VYFIELESVSTKDINTTGVGASGPYSATSGTLASASEFALAFGVRVARGLVNPETITVSNFTTVQQQLDDINYDPSWFGSLTTSSTSALTTTWNTGNDSTAGDTAIITYLISGATSSPKLLTLGVG